MKKIKVVVGAVIVGVVLAGCISYGFNLQGKTPFKKHITSSTSTPYVLTGDNGQVLALQNAFVQIAKMVKPAVVQITTEKTVTYRYWDPFQDFEEFFNFPFDGFFSTPRRREQRPKTYERKQQGLGSGFIVDEDGYILTNNHVIQGVDKILVKLQDDTRTYDAKVVGTDPKTDLALIKIQAKHPLPYARLGDSDKIEPGEWVMAIGNPMGLTATVTVGIVSAKGRSGFGITQYEDFIQTDAAINPGNSGGPLININGEVIGINTFIVSPAVAEGLGFAIPINMAKQVFSQLKEKGRVVRGYIGVYLQPMSEELATSFGMKEVRGALVSRVLPGGPAEKAGIQEGDIILKFDGMDVKDDQDLRMKVAGTPVGKKVAVVVWRNKKEVSLTLVTDEMPSDERMAEMEEKQMWRGMMVTSITPEIKEQLGLKDSDGVVVISVEPGSPAEEAGITQGVVIKEINGMKIKGLSEYKKVVKDIPKDKSVRLLIMKAEQSMFIILKGEK
ncbi:MAG: DegQ family serine endoprotease [Candidatus Ratteibacteria bacterium]|nr:DegQ family serine endoprotease [Candidatus Ratteibacteria bacterium]